MIGAPIFVLRGLAVLSVMGLLHVVLAEDPRHAQKHCLDEGFEAHCSYSDLGYDKYVCKKLVCAKNEGGTMIAIDTGKVPDEGSPCTYLEKTNKQLLVVKICIKGFCRRVLNGSKLKFSGERVAAVDCWNRRGELFYGGSINRAEKCHKRP